MFRYRIPVHPNCNSCEGPAQDKIMLVVVLMTHLKIIIRTETQQGILLPNQRVDSLAVDNFISALKSHHDRFV